MLLQITQPTAINLLDGNGAVHYGVGQVDIANAAVAHKVVASGKATYVSPGDNPKAATRSSGTLVPDIAAIGSPVTLFQSGLPFVRFAGDGGSNGLLFTGTAGNFTLSAAVATSATFASGYGYLPANAGGLGNAAGWFYFTMSSDTAGVFYNNSYNPATEIPPAVPSSPTAFANPAGGRISQETAEITCVQKTLAAGYPGINGLIALRIKTFANNSGTTKQFYLRANAIPIGNMYFSSSGIVDAELWSQMSGRLDQQINTKHGSTLGSTSATIYRDFSSADFSVSMALTVSITAATNTDTFAVVVRQLTIAPGA